MSEVRRASLNFRASEVSFDRTLNSTHAGENGMNAAKGLHAGSAMLSESALRQVGKELAGRFQFEQDDRLWADFQEVLVTAEAPNLQGAHRAASVNALSSFWQYGCEKDAKNSNTQFSSFKIWRRVFYIYLDRYHGSPPKPMKQLLTAIGKSLKDIDSPERDSKKQLVCQECLLHIIEQEDVSKVKPALICLEYFLNRSIISTSILLSTFTFSSSRYALSGTKHDSSSFQSFILKILSWLAHSELAPHAGRLVVACYTSAPSDNPSSGGWSWSETLKLFVEQHPEDLEPLELFVLPGLLDAPGSDLSRILEPVSKLLSNEGLSSSDNLISEADARLSLLILQKFKSSAKSNDAARLVLSHEHINAFAKMLTRCDSSTTRLAALRVLIEDQKIGAPIKEDIFDHLRAILPDLHYDDEPKARNDLLSIIKRLFKRLAVLHSRDTIAQDQAALKTVVEFIRWYGGFLVEELAPQVPYQRHFMTLKILENLHAESLTQIWLNAEDLKRRESLEALMSRSLLALMLDAFDDIRAGAASLLRHQNGQKTGMISEALDSALDGAESRLIASGRADIADGAGRLFAVKFASSASGRLSMLQSLLTTLHNEVDGLLGSSSSSQPAFPMHGSLIKLRYLISSEHYLPCITQASNQQEDWRSFHAQIVQICQRVWNITRPILCDDSPEGQSFGNLGNENEPEAVEEKSVLSSAWRSLREAALLLSTMVTAKAYENSSQNAIMQLEDLELMAGLLLQQLSDLRHRGAFSTVASAFNLVCGRIISSQGQPGRAFIRSLEQRTIEELKAQGSKLTRRSAGVPAMITGILCATSTIRDEQNFLEKIFEIADSAIVDNRSVGGDLVLPQVHALNCLKDVFTNSKLSEVSEPYLERALNMAVQNLSSTIWAIRNCGLMLLKALLIRIAEGNTEAGSSDFGYRKKFTRRSYAKYPDLGTIVISLLGKTKSLASPTMLLGEDDMLMYATYPALEILERFGITDDLHASVVTPLLELFESTLWLLREKAARVISTLLDDTNILDRFIKQEQQGSLTSNALHGWLLCIKHCLNRQAESSESFIPPLGLHSSSLTFCKWAATCSIHNPIIASTIIDIVVSLRPTTDKFVELNQLIENIHARISPLTELGDPLLEASLARLNRIPSGTASSYVTQEDAKALLPLDMTTTTPFQAPGRDSKSWKIRLRLMIQPARPLGDRQAVVDALRKTYGVFMESLPEESRLEMNLVQLEALNDDDPEIRRDASRIDMPQISHMNGELDRLLWLDSRISSQRLHQKLVTDYLALPGLLEECLYQIVGLDYEHFLALRSANPTIQLRSVQQQLEDCFEQENVLFVIEKPNLYVDRLNEVYKWISLFQKIPDEGFSSNRTQFVEHCLTWMLTGVKYILDEQQDVFKIMRNQDAFVLCVRTLCSFSILRRFSPTGMSNDDVQNLEQAATRWLSEALTPSAVQRILGS